MDFVDILSCITLIGLGVMGFAGGLYYIFCAIEVKQKLTRDWYAKRLRKSIKEMEMLRKEMSINV